ncbi:MAG TPA: hypothetical protein VHD36_23685 [Pirellulales bacterium]|nr:hypothetical protein [Pirellulales bacterium]
MQVYVVWCIHEHAKDHFDLKPVGFYSSKENAEAAKIRALSEPGFIELSDKLSIAQFTLDKDVWPLGSP